MFRLAWLLCLLFAQDQPAISGEEPPVVPLAVAHAHNDYLHKRPLLDALDCGFTSVEADVWLWNGQLLVGHWPWDLQAERSLEKLYLEPLRDRLKANAGRVYPAGPTFILLIDIKTDAQKTHAALEKSLAPYAELLTVVQDGKSEVKAITVVLSGNVDREAIGERKTRHAAIDGRVADLESTAPAHLILWISASWDAHFRWQGEGAMPADERDRLRAMVRQAHERGRELRFWNTPEKPDVWKELRAAGVDRIGTDKLDDLRRFLK